MDTKCTITIATSQRCNFKCEMCPAGCPKHDGPVVDLDAALRWLDEFHPGCSVHISGGEPLLLSGIVDGVRNFVDSGYDVTVFTNGSLIAGNLGLADLPIKWQVTHHAGHIRTADFLSNIRYIQDSKHLICRLRHGKEALNNKDAVERLYDGFNFRWILPHNGYFGYVEKANEGPICEDILMIGNDGEIFPCSTTRGVTLGNIYDMTFDVTESLRFKCVCGKVKNRCQAYQSAELMRGL